MADNKTKPTGVSPHSYLETMKDNPRTKDAAKLIDLISSVTQSPATMWGTSIIGFGIHVYTHATGRSGTTPAIGFALRAKAFALYGIHQILEDNPEQSLQLGRHTMAKGCVYIDSLDHVDLKILGKIVHEAYQARNNAR